MIKKLDHHENGYIPPTKRTVNNDDELLKLKKEIKNILNKLAPENYENCLKDINALSLGYEDAINCLVNELFTKATLEQSYSTSYAKLCSTLSSLKVADITFRSRLMKKCQAMFMKPLETQMNEIRALWLDKIEKETDERMKKMYAEDIEENVCKAKDKYFGNLRFISELYLQNSFNGKILIKCVSELLTDKASAISIDGACMMLPVCGKVLETNFPQDMDIIFREITKLSKCQTLERKSRFKLMDIIDMKARKWEMREIQKMKSVVPKTLEDIRKDETHTVISKPIIKNQAVTFQKNANKVPYVPSIGAWKCKSQKPTM